MKNVTRISEKPLIHVVVPVYNVEAYLPACLDSIRGQSYEALDILLIDDGSTDGSGAVCGRYAAEDARFRVFHTENRGLSAARNEGIRQALARPGDYLMFIDSDDWLEPDMAEKLLNAALEAGADVAACGVFLEYRDKTIPSPLPAGCWAREEAIKKIFLRELDNRVVNKLWRRSIFETLRFPSGKVYEDAATAHKAILKADTLVSVPDVLYHYRQREGSIIHQHSLKNLFDRWDAYRERCREVSSGELFAPDEAVESAVLEQCGLTLLQVWMWANDVPKAERNTYRDRFAEMAAFARAHIPRFGKKGWRWELRLGSFLIRSDSAPAFALAHGIKRLLQAFQPKNLYAE